MLNYLEADGNAHQLNNKKVFDYMNQHSQLEVSFESPKEHFFSVDFSDSLSIQQYSVIPSPFASYPVLTNGEVGRLSYRTPPSVLSIREASMLLGVDGNKSELAKALNGSISNDTCWLDAVGVQNYVFSETGFSIVSFEDWLRYSSVEGGSESTAFFKSYDSAIDMLKSSSLLELPEGNAVSHPFVLEFNGKRCVPLSFMCQNVKSEVDKISSIYHEVYEDVAHGNILLGLFLSMNALYLTSGVMQ